MERLHAGWLVKSPPEKKTLGPWRLFKSKWRQRFFVLYAPPSAQSIPGCCSAVLCYYDDETMTKEYGRIDLNHCEEILTQLESDDHRFVFALRAVNKDNERTYYLAADSEEEMNAWADCLCCVLRLSGGDGIAFSSGFGLPPSSADNLLNSSLPRFSILTQKTGEQRRLSNVPETISKSATALNIRVAELTPHSSNTASRLKPTKVGKRQSILNMVVKPASTGTIRRPSCPTLTLNGVQNKFQTMSRAGTATPTVKPPSAFPSLNAQSPVSDLHNPSFTLARPVPKLQIEPASPMVTYDNFVASGHQDRWRFGGRSSEGDDSQQCPPALPSRVTRNASSVQRRENYHVPNRHRNSMEDSLPKSIWRDSDFHVDECDEGSRDPDYDLPNLNYDCEDLTRAGSETLENEAPEDDREDDYSYPQFHCTLESPEVPLRNQLSVVEETEGTNDSYDYLPCCSASNRTSAARSSTQMSSSDNISFDDRGIYDILPIRDSSATEGNGSRMSGIEICPDDSGLVYQNDVFCRSPVDIYDYPQLQNPSPFPDVNSATYANALLPPLPEKKTCGHKEAEKVVEKRRAVPLPPATPVVSQSDAHSYMNANEMRMSDYSTNGSQGEGVYLLMSCGKASDSIYTPMHSPDGNIFATVPTETIGNRSDEEVRNLLDVLEPSIPKHNQSSANGQTSPHGPALMPIRFTANTRSFKRKTPSRTGSDHKEDSLGSSVRHKENQEPSALSNPNPPPLPPKTRLSNGSSYIHYAALDLEASTGDGRPPSNLSDRLGSPGSGCFQSDTLYRTIDMEKTKALCDLKKQMEDDRQRNSGNLSPEH